MMFEDFFTLKELKDGLTSPDRVKELMAVMQKEKGCVVKNVGDASTHWHIVANIIAVTESKDCLDLFVESDGLWFINRWLTDVQKSGNDSGFQESTTLLLRALDRLQLDDLRLVSSGILSTVLELVGHSDCVVHEKAKVLCDKWMQRKDDEKNPPVAISPAACRNDDDEEKLAKQSGNEITPSVCFDRVQVDAKEKPSADKSVDLGTTKVGPGDTSDKEEEVVDSSGYNSKSGVAESESGADDTKKHVGGHSGENSGSSRPSIKGEEGGGRSMEPDYRVVDPPLEVSREVATEVEREVDARGGVESPDSKNGKESLLIGGSTKLASSGPGPGPGPEPSPKAMRVNDGETTLGSVSEVAQESEANTERCFSGFDLNQEFWSEEIERPMDSVTTPISVVSASRADLLPVLQFEGNRGWKGSAVTSAFRRIAESGTSSNSKQCSDRLNIDLNVAEDSEDKIEGYSSRNKNPIISGLPSGEESSIEACSRRSARLHLDLNSLGDGSVDNVVLNQNGCRSPSQSSSSSIMQPSMRNIDLNSNDFPNDASYNLGNLFNNTTASRGVQSQDESAISLFGTMVEVKPKDVAPQPPIGRMLEPAMELRLERGNGAMGVYGRGTGGWGPGSSMGLYGHNGFPSMYLSSPYGPVGAATPYMVDPRGGVPPQFEGSSSAQPPAPSQQAPGFLMNMGGGGGSQQQQVVDLNEGQMSWVVGGKRQEPDGGFDCSPPGNYKHQQPPWKGDP